MDNIVLEGQVSFGKTPTVGLPEESNLIDPAINKTEADQRKQNFLNIKIPLNSENGFTMNTQNYYIT